MHLRLRPNRYLRRPSRSFAQDCCPLLPNQSDIRDSLDLCTGSGKSYTMMGGAEEEKGIIPRLCEQVFQRIAELSSETVSYKVLAQSPNIRVKVASAELIVFADRTFRWK